MGDEPSAGELSRLFERLSNEISGLHRALDRLVRVDVYEAHRLAMTADMRRIEADLAAVRSGLAEQNKEREKERAEQDRLRAQDQAANKRVLWGAALAMVATIIASVLVQVILG